MGRLGAQKLWLEQRIGLGGEWQKGVTALVEVVGKREVEWRP